MKPTPLALGPERLLGEADFVRALSRSLLADRAAADDVAQDALVAGLEHPPEHAGVLRAWLARVVRNFAIQRGRGEARRAAREGQVARAERIPSAAEVLEREAARTSVVRAVLALEEPYRTAILLRFYEGQPPRAIARQLRLPVETVHTHTKRALAQLRERLDREFGARSAWAALLLPFARPPLAPWPEGASSPSPIPREFPMSLVKLAAVGLVLATGAVLLLRSSAFQRNGAKQELAVEASAQLAPSAAVVAADGGDAGRESGTPAPVAPPLRAVATTAPLPAASSALSTGSLRLALTWADGTPAADQTVRVADVGRVFHEPLEERTDAAGECLFSGLRAGRVLISPERAEIWSSAQVTAGAETVLAVQLERGWDVEGMVVDASGDAVAGATVWLGEIGATSERAFAVATSAADGSFFVRACPDLSSLWARMPGHAPSMVRTLAETRTQPAGTSVQVSLALAGPGAAVGGVVRDPEGNPVEGALVLVDGQGMLRATPLTLPGGDVTYLSHSGPTSTRTDAAGRFSVAGVRPGSVPIGVLAPGHAAWRRSVEAAAGAAADVTITLAPGFTLTGTVRDAGGTPASGRVFVLLASAQLSPTVMTGADGAFEFVGLAPGQVRVSVDGPSGEAWTTLTGQAGEVLTWDAFLGPEERAELWFESEPWR